jgi:hypothetical protein
MAAPRPLLKDGLWGHAKAAFASALAAPPARREAAARRLCRGDAALEAEVLSLLRHHGESGGFLAPPGFHPVRGLLPATVRDRVAAGAPPRLRRGAVVAGRYEVEGPLGRGGFGTVARARDRLLDRPVALRVMPAADEAAGAAWRREVATLRRARLPGVASLLDDGREGGAAFVVMELVEGRPFPGGGAPVPWARFADTAAAFLEALARLHAVRVAHRDLKPANVLVDAAGVPVIVDLGAAVDGAAPGGPDGALVGTRGYLAPELLGGAPPGERSDLFAAGVLLFRALAGRLPGEGDRARRLPAGRAPRAVRALVAALLRPDPRERPASAEEEAAILRGATLGGGGGGAGRGPGTGGPVGAVLRAHGAAPPGPRLRPRELCSLFAGPDALFHLREDAARELSRRTRGDREAVERTLRSWAGAGLARREGEVLVVEPAAVARLRCLDDRPASRGGAGRIVRLLASGTPGSFPRHALRTARAAPGSRRRRPSSARTSSTRPGTGTGPSRCSRSRSARRRSPWSAGGRPPSCSPSGRSPTPPGGRSSRTPSGGRGPAGTGRRGWSPTRSWRTPRTAWRGPS